MTYIFITGASGFIGRPLTRRLVSEGHTVKALVRSKQSFDIVAALGAEPFYGELTDPSTWQDAVRGSEVMFHLAAETDVTAPRVQQDRVTVYGTIAALAAAATAGVTRFVHCSSEAVLLDGEPLVNADETAPLRPNSPAAYAATKARAEQIVVAANSDTMTTVAIRPKLVWGPGSFIEGLPAAAASGNFVWIDGGVHEATVTHVDNAVEGLILGWRRGGGGEAYFVSDGDPVSFREFMEEQFAVYGYTGSVSTVTGAEADATVPAPARWFFGQTLTLNIAKARADLRYEPVTSHADGIAALEASLR
jgi:nucleoside-diphosphate-sugar epimerase